MTSTFATDDLEILRNRAPSRRAYVLKLRSDAGPDSLAGRLENLVTGQQREFDSGQALLDVMVRDLLVDWAGRIDKSRTEC